jgi:hypothetical protein
MLLVTVFIRDDSLQSWSFNFEVDCGYFAKGFIPLFSLLSNFLGGLHLFPVSDGLYTFCAYFGGNFWPISFREFANLFPDEATALLIVNDKAEVVRTAVDHIELVDIDTSPFLRVIAAIFAGHKRLQGVIFNRK